MNYWLEVHWPLMDGTPRKELFVWFHEEELGQISKYQPGDRVAFYITKRNPYPGAPSGRQAIFATGTVADELEPVDLAIGGKRYVFRRKVNEDLFPELDCWIPRREVNKLVNWSEDYKYQQARSLTHGQFQKIEDELARRIDVQSQSRFFVVNAADSPISSEYADIEGESYGFDQKVSGWRQLVDAHVRARLIFYRTSNATNHQMHYVATANVASVAMSAPGIWRAKLCGYTAFPSPVGKHAVTVDGNIQHSIRSIPGEQFFKVLHMGGVSELGKSGAPIVSANIQGATIISNSPIPDRPIHGSLLPAKEGLVPLPPENQVATNDLDSGTSGPRGRANRNLDKAAEESAVHIVRFHLHKLGWELIRDCQKSGTGYDLEYKNGPDLALVEVKGIRGNTLAFNMTAKEWMMATANRNYFVITVIRVLTDTYEVHILGQEKLFQMRRSATQFRLK